MVQIYTLFTHNIHTLVIFFKKFLDVLIFRVQTFLKNMTGFKHLSYLKEGVMIRGLRLQP